MGRLAVAANRRVQRFVQNIGNLAYSSGGSPVLTIPQADYTTGFDLISKQQVVTGATAPVYAGYGAFGAIGQITVSVNGARHPFSLSGYQADVYDRVRSEPYASQLTSNPNAINATNNIVNHIHVPLTLAEDTTRGAWFTGDTSLQVTLKMQMAAAAQVFATVNGATIQGSWDVFREAFNAPPPDLSAEWLDAISWYHEVSVQGTYTLRNGNTNIDLPRDADYQRILLNFYTGNNTDGTFAPADGLYTTVDVSINNRIHPFDTISEAQRRFEAVRTYAEVLPSGWAVIDFERIKDSVRDILPTDGDKVSLLRLTINAPAANNVDVITETVVDNPLAAKWIRQAQARQAAAPAGR